MPHSREINTLQDLPRAPASDVKKLGWRGMMKTVRHTGKVLVTNHEEPEAVILSMGEYDTLMRTAHASAANDAATLDALRRRFDERLASLQADDAGARLRKVIHEPARLRNKVKAGTGH
jgi:prevent-host-death family protein